MNQRTVLTSSSSRTGWKNSSVSCLSISHATATRHHPRPIQRHRPSKASPACELAVYVRNRCQGRSKIRPRWRRKTRPPGRWAECLSAVVRTGWSGVWDRPWGGLRRSGNPCAQPRRRGGEASGRRGGRVGAGLLAVFEAVAVAVELEDVDVMGQPVEQRAGEAFGAEDLGPFVEGEIRGHER